MRNIKLSLEYDGTDFCGFELQPGKRTIRGELEKALKRIYKRPVKFYAASRTDAGVHAVGQVVSFKPPIDIPLKRLPAALNSVLPGDIRIRKAEETAKTFNARFNAKAKVYEYLIFNSVVMPPQLRKLAWHVKPELDLSAMRSAAKILVGKHDFSSFCASGGDDKDFVRKILKLDIRNSKLEIWQGHVLRILRFRVTGNGFLYKMVRNLMGTLVDVGLGRLKPIEVKRILEAKNRRLAGRTAPAYGLCLISVKY